MDQTEALQGSIKNVVQAVISAAGSNKKVPKDKKRQRLTREKGDEEDVPHVDELRKALSGGSTVIRKK